VGLRNERENGHRAGFAARDRLRYAP
jgi:hypothetical protein